MHMQGSTAASGGRVPYGACSIGGSRAAGSRVAGSWVAGQQGGAVLEGKEGSEACATGSLRGGGADWGMCECRACTQRAEAGRPREGSTLTAAPPPPTGDSFIASRTSRDYTGGGTSGEQEQCGRGKGGREACGPEQGSTAVPIIMGVGRRGVAQQDGRAAVLHIMEGVRLATRNILPSPLTEIHGGNRNHDCSAWRGAHV